MEVRRFDYPTIDRSKQLHTSSFSHRTCPWLGMTTTACPTVSTTALGKRKKPTFSLTLSSSPASQENFIDDTRRSTKTSTSDLLVISELSSVGKSKKQKYPCTHEGCPKSYSKPARLSEHLRSHTGERPFVCEECAKSYLRDTHLRAHKRSHLPDSEKPFVCTGFSDCKKRFWTSQHLRVHENYHRGEKPYNCTENGCKEAFAKHHQLRAHVCEVHSPPGTKPYICPDQSCTKSFLTTQKLRAHMKTHDDKRYACAHATCVPEPGQGPLYFGTWTALQAHMRAAHPPTCTHGSCQGRTFASHYNLRAHLKLHEQHAAEEGLQDSEESDDETISRRKRRRGGELGRDWKCDQRDCEKDFKSKKALTAHHKIKHLGHREHVCPQPNCDSAFGYKHLLKRHVAKHHAFQSSSEHPEEISDSKPSSPNGTGLDLSIDEITGKAYTYRSRNSNSVACPYPHIGQLLSSHGSLAIPSSSSGSTCEHVTSRAYDLWRHLKVEHGVIIDKEVVGRWVDACKQASDA